MQGNPNLTPTTPVTLATTNDAGVTFKRKISVDDKFMFTVEDTIENGGSQPVTLSSYGRVTRYSKPQVASRYILFEGLLGVFGDSGLSEVKYSSIESDGKVVPPEASSGWLGITDKYWATTLIPEGGKPFKSRFLYLDGKRPHYQTEYRRRRDDDSRRRHDDVGGTDLRRGEGRRRRSTPTSRSSTSASSAS